MKSYSKAPEECTDRVKHLIKCFYRDLYDAGLRVDILSVTNDDPDAAPLTHQGYKAAAVIRVLDSKARAKGAGDVEIVIDEAHYLTLNDAQKDALLDHEIHHVELRTNKKGRVKLDEHGRPKCGMRKHDYQFGWFTAIAARHGAAAMEVKQATQLFLREKQTFFAFVDNPAALPSGESVAEKLVQNASVGKAVQNFVDMAKKDGMTVEIRAAGKSVKIGADGVEGDITEEQLKQAKQLAKDAGYLTKSGLKRAMKLSDSHAHVLLTRLITDGVVGPVEDDKGRFKTITEQVSAAAPSA